MKKLNKITILSAVCAALLFGCTTVPVVTDSMTAPELIQKGQNEFESGNYKNAVFYYNTAIDRFGDNGSVYIEARYEIGHIFMKQKDYNSAVPVFDEIVSLFNVLPPGTLPAAYKKLAQLELEKIPADELTKIRAEIQKKQSEENRLESTVQQ